MHHNEVTHRDLKPANILLTDKSGELNIKIADFGFSCIYDPKVGLDNSLGTPMFMAPELLNFKPYNEKVDIWATMVIAYSFLSAGQLPWDVSTRDELVAAVNKKEPKYTATEFKKVSK